jgi:hypothetical protein
MANDGELEAHVRHCASTSLPTNIAHEPALHTLKHRVTPSGRGTARPCQIGDKHRMNSAGMGSLAGRESVVTVVTMIDNGFHLF